MRWSAFAFGAVVCGFLGSCGGGSLGERDARVDGAPDPADAGPGDAGPGDATPARDGSVDSGASDASSPPDAASDGGAEVERCPRLGTWQQSEPWGTSPSHPLPSFAVGDRYYVHTADARALMFATVEGDGRLGPWRNAGDHGGGPHGFTAVAVAGEAFHFRNGHIARYRFGADGSLAGIDLLEESTAVAFGGNLYVWDVAVVVGPPMTPRGVIHLGGFSFAGYMYRPHVMSSGVPLQPRFTRIGEFPVARPGNAAYVETSPGEGWIFAREAGAGRLFRARVRGLELVPFEEIAALPDGDGNGRGDMVALGCTLVVVRGRQVFASDIDSEGGLRGFEAQPPLPEAQIDVSWGDGHQEGAAWGVVGDHLLLTGPRRVFVAPIL